MELDLAVAYIHMWLLTPWISFVVNVEVQLATAAAHTQVVVRNTLAAYKVLCVSIILYECMQVTVAGSWVATCHEFLSFWKIPKHILKRKQWSVEQSVS